jgi:hypothetical protein
LTTRRFRGFNTYLEWDRGFHGWLVVWFATVVSALFFEAVSLVRIGRAAARLWAAAGPNAWIVRAALVADIIWSVGIFVALVYGLSLFLREERTTRRFWIWYYSLIAAAACGLRFLALYRESVSRHVPVGSTLLSTMTWRATSGIVLPLAWGLYWALSKRVRITYGTIGAEA